MQANPTFVLLVEGDDSQAESILRAFELYGSSFSVSAVSTLSQASEKLGQASLVITDLVLPDGRGIDLIKQAHTLPRIAITRTSSDVLAAESIKAGASEYVFLNGDAVQNLPRIAQRVLHEWETQAERRRIEQRLLQVQKMESIGRLAGGIAHDFNNLLTIIMGFADIAGTEVASDSAAQKSIQQIRQASERACEMTRQLLTFARRQPLIEHLIDIRTMLENSRPAILRTLGEQIELEIRAAVDLPRVKADAARLQEMLLYLAANARDSIKGEGTFTITAAAVTSDVRSDLPTGQYVKISFTDSGPGIPAHLLPQIFEPFLNSNELNRGSKGTGLGLATCYGIVKQHQGQILVESSPGKGCTFHVYFPASQEAAPKLDDSSSRRNLPTGTETILVVEDESLVRSLTTRILRGLQYNVVEAIDGQDALQVVEKYEGKIDLLLTDVVMPRMGGFELAQRLREQHDVIRVLYVSGYSDSEDLQNDISLDKAGFLHKPFSRSSLAYAVRKALDSSVPGI